jgi:hypothetical protein
MPRRNTSAPNIILMAREPQRYEDARRLIDERLQEIGYPVRRVRPETPAYAKLKAA